MLSSDTVEASFLSCEATGGFAVGVVVDFAVALAGAAAAGGGAYLAVLRCESMSYKVLEGKDQGRSYLDIRIVYVPIYSPSLQWILVCILRVHLTIARCQYVQILCSLALCLSHSPCPSYLKRPRL